MIKNIHIQNYKSLADLNLELGRVNVLIGENGSGKTNILEAVALGCAAFEQKLDNAYLASMGIRLTEGKAMKSGFTKETLNNNIIITIAEGLIFTLKEPKNFFEAWTSDNIIGDEIEEFVNQILLGKDEVVIGGDTISRSEIMGYSNKIVHFIIKHAKKILPQDAENKIKEQIKELAKQDFLEKLDIKDFKIFAPENYFLRRFEDEANNGALGTRGEGLFKLLSQISFEDKTRSDNEKQLPKIQECLEILGWYDGFEIPNDLFATEKRLKIKDRFLAEGLDFFDQKSANEGFLYLLFYFTLFISDYTPRFFAIDNIDNGMNPKMCMELMKILTRLAKEHNKQVIFTTHNPGILDGLDLNDNEVRLLVASRNKIGHTKVNRVERKPMPEGIEPMRLSEMFINGMLGGLPKNF